ncbi:interferon regulatory factor 3 [Genypterus blacodes]|uniref:interferon regulatory factor 3 n=1 Tax=Genypterus blacodes TaxID=154954 RepID=UPI003F765F06
MSLIYQVNSVSQLQSVHRVKRRTFRTETIYTLWSSSWTLGQVSSASGMAHSKPLFIPWLLIQIDGGKFPGVGWTNPERTMFSIPWKHSLRKDASREDVLIFKAWAVISGNGTAQGEPSVWKRNFRSTLRVKGFTMLDDKKNDAANPHKIFQWPESKSEACSSGGSQEQDVGDLLERYPLPIQDSQVVPCFEDSLYLPEEDLYAVSTIDADILEDCLKGMNLSPDAESTIDTDILEECLKGMNPSPDTEGNAIFEPTPEQQLQNQYVIGGHALPGQQPHPVKFEGADSGVVSPEQPTQPMDGAVGGVCDQQRVEQFQDMMQKTIDGDHFKTDFKVMVYYRGVKVSEQVVQNETGFRLVYNPGFARQLLDPGSGLSLVSLPSIGGMLDQTQARLTQRILDMLGEGVEVGVSGPMVYGQRRGDCKAYWSYSKFDQNLPPQDVSKLPLQPVFLFKEFIRGIWEFINGKESPPISLFFCLGEKWPDPNNRLWVKKLITVEVVFTSLEILKTIAVEGGASSLRSVELQLSLEEMMDTW